MKKKDRWWNGYENPYLEQAMGDTVTDRETNKIIKNIRCRLDCIGQKFIGQVLNGRGSVEKLEDEDLVFIKKFVLASGSLKEIAKEYDVTYPTVRLRLDRLIQKIKVCDEMDNDPYIALVKRFAVDEKIDFDTAKRLIAEYKKQVEKGGK